MTTGYFHDLANKVVTRVDSAHTRPQRSVVARDRATGWWISSYLYKVSAAQGRRHSKSGPAHYARESQGVEDAKTRYMRQLVTGLGEAIDKATFESLAATYLGEFNDRQAKPSGRP